MKASRTVWSGGKAGDDIKGLPIAIIVLEVTQDSGQNDFNREKDRPYINYEIEGNQVKLEFVNPTKLAFVFDYRIDGEEGTLHDWSNIVISEGELQGQEIGPWYNPVTVINGTHTVTVTVKKELWVGMRLGAEQSWYLDWIIFEAKTLN